MKKRRAQVGKQFKLAAQPEQCFFRSVVAAEVVPLGAAHRAEQHGIGLFASLHGVLGKRTAASVNRDTAGRLFGEGKFVPVNLAHAVKRHDCLANNVRTYSVAGNGDNIEFHYISLLVKVYFYSVCKKT